MIGHVEHQHDGKRCLIPRRSCDFYLQYDRAEYAFAANDDLHAAYSALKARIAAALEQHHPSQGMCETCGTDYPCQTRRALIEVPK